MPRLFFALWPDDAVRDALAARRDAIAFAYGGRPMLPATFHLTLAFIGEANELKVPTLLSCGDCVRAIRAIQLHAVPWSAKAFYTASHR